MFRYRWEGWCLRLRPIPHDRQACWTGGRDWVRRPPLTTQAAISAADRWRGEVNFFKEVLEGRGWKSVVCRHMAHHPIVSSLCEGCWPPCLCYRTRKRTFWEVDVWCKVMLLVWCLQGPVARTNSQRGYMYLAGFLAWIRKLPAGRVATALNLHF